MHVCETCELGDKVLERQAASTATTLWSLAIPCTGLDWLKRSHVKVIQRHLFSWHVCGRRVWLTCVVVHSTPAIKPLILLVIKAI
jgi:hypothetical protein